MRGRNVKSSSNIAHKELVETEACSIPRVGKLDV